MTIIGIALIIIAISVAAVAAALIPAIAEIKRTAVAARETLEKTEAEMTPAIAELREAIKDIKELTSAAAEGKESIRNLMSAAGDTTRGLRTIGTVMDAAAGMVSNSALWMTGAKVAGRFILDRIRQRKIKKTGGENNG